MARRSPLTGLLTAFVYLFAGLLLSLGPVALAGTLDAIQTSSVEQAVARVLVLDPAIVVVVADDGSDIDPDEADDPSDADGVQADPPDAEPGVPVSASRAEQRPLSIRVIAASTAAAPIDVVVIASQEHRPPGARAPPLA